MSTFNLSTDYIVSTDLDGTLLDHHNYCWQAAQPAINTLSKHNIPIIFNTSKTLAETRQLQDEIGIAGPVIIENGSALAIQDNILHALGLDTTGLNTQKSATLTIINFGCDRSEILAFIQSERTKNALALEGFNDWSTKEIAEKVNLPIESAELSAKKMYSEPFIWKDSQEAFQQFNERAEKKGLKILQGGRFYHLLGKTNKAKPIEWLRDAIQNAHPNKIAPKLICLGDNKNDIDMLNIADYPVCIKSPISDYPSITNTHPVIYTTRYGPQGWNDAIAEIITA